MSVNDRSDLAHPWLGVQLMGGDEAPAYRVHALGVSTLAETQQCPCCGAGEPSQGGKLTITVKALVSSEGVACADLDGVEKLALDHILANAEVMPYRASTIEINRASSYIALSTRRGMGNTVLIHPDTLRDLIEETDPEYRSIFPRWNPVVEQIAGWTKEFEGEYDPATRHIIFWSKQVMPRDKIVVLYANNAIDSPYFACGHHNTPYFIENNVGDLCKAKDYARVINCS